MSSVTFVPADFKIRYPEFSAVSDSYLQSCFNEATLYLSNDDCSVVQDLNVRKTLLWMLTAHIAFTGGALNPDKTPSPPGRLSSATEGSVSISTEYNISENAAWFAQSAYGAAFWQATLRFRQFRYFARPTRY